MRLVERVWRLLGPKSDVAFPAQYVVPALRIAAVMVWANTMRPTVTQTLDVVDGVAEVPDTLWPMQADAGDAGRTWKQIVVSDPDTTAVTVRGSTVPPPITPFTETAGWEEELDEAVAETAAAILLASSMPDAASMWMKEAAEKQRRVMRQWRNSQKWRLRA